MTAAAQDEKIGPYLKKYIVDWRECPAAIGQETRVVCLHDLTCNGVISSKQFAVSIQTQSGERLSWVEHANYWGARHYYEERIRLLLDAIDDKARAKELA